MDIMQRLRLKYEDSGGCCHVCGQPGIIGATLKLFDNVGDAGIQETIDESEFYLRCADRAVCSQRKAKEPR